MAWKTITKASELTPGARVKSFSGRVYVVKRRFVSRDRKPMVAFADGSHLRIVDAKAGWEVQAS